MDGNHEFVNCTCFSNYSISYFIGKPERRNRSQVHDDDEVDLNPIESSRDRIQPQSGEEVSDPFRKFS